jgi:hypothetical protein
MTRVLAARPARGCVIKAALIDGGASALASEQPRGLHAAGVCVWCGHLGVCASE